MSVVAGVAGSISSVSKIPDSGNRVIYEGGAERDRPPGKGKFVLLSPIAMKRIALRCEEGHIKYGDGRNWEKGMPISEFIDSSIRHTMQYLEGDTSEDHLAAAAWNLQAAMHMEVVKPEFQDLAVRLKGGFIVGD